MKHGTISGYKRFKCRCEMCRAANAAVAARYLARHPTKRRSPPKVEFEQWAKMVEFLKNKYGTWTALERESGIKAYTLRASYMLKRSIRKSTFDQLQDVYDRFANAPLPSEQKQPSAREFKKAWDEVFRYLYRGGFTKETLAERLNIPLVRLQRFIDSCYKEDRPLAMRIAQLRWIMIQGEREDDDGQSEYERADSVA